MGDIPSTPTIVIRPVALDQSLQFYWYPPENNTVDITEYVLSCPEASFTQSIPPTDGMMVTTVSSLTNGSNYTFTVSASNANGQGPEATFRTVEPGNYPPNPPISVSTLSLTQTSALIKWSAPLFGSGGASIKWYTITATPTDPQYSTIIVGANGIDRERYIDNLNPSASYNFEVNAVNDPGYSPPGIPGPAYNFSPSSITGLQVWLDMSDPLYYTLSNTTVSTILDKSGNGYDMNQPGYQFLPSIGTPINGLTTAYFAPADGIKNQTMLNGVTNMFWVGRQGVQGSFCYLFGDDTNYDWHGNNGAFVWNSYAQPGIYNAPYWFYSSNLPAPGTGQFLNRGLPSVGTNFILNVNGLTGNTRYRGVCYAIGGDTDRGWVGDLGEVLVFSNALSDNEINQIREYLHIKWNI